MKLIKSNKIYFHEFDFDWWKKRFDKLLELKFEIIDKENDEIKFFDLLNSSFGEFTRSELVSVITSVKYDLPYFIMSCKSSFENEDECLLSIHGTMCLIQIDLHFTEEELFFVNRHYKIDENVIVFKDKIGIRFNEPEEIND